MPFEIALPQVGASSLSATPATSRTNDVSTHLPVIAAIDTVTSTLPHQQFVGTASNTANNTGNIVEIHSARRERMLVAEEILQTSEQRLDMQQASHNLCRLMRVPGHLAQEMQPLYDIVIDMARIMPEENAAQFIQSITNNLSRDILLEYNLSRWEPASASGIDFPLRELDEVVHDFIANPPGHTSLPLHLDWKLFIKEPGANKFAQFLEAIEGKGIYRTLHLHGNVNAALRQFRESLVNLLGAIAVNADLREQVFSLAADGLNACQDRVTWMFNNMKVAQLHEEVKAGHYDQKLPDLIAKAREIFRLDALSEIAVKKLQSFPKGVKIDEIELYLAYQTLAGKQLQLSLVAPTMAYRVVAAVTDTELENAVTMIRQDENSHFLSFLQNWMPWQALLERIAPEAYQTAIDKRNWAIENIEMLLQERLAKEGQPRTPTSEKIWGKEIANEITETAFYPATRAVLNKDGLLFLLDPVWEMPQTSAPSRLSSASTSSASPSPPPLIAPPSAPPSALSSPLTSQLSCNATATEVIDSAQEIASNTGRSDLLSRSGSLANRYHPYAR